LVNILIEHRMELARNLKIESVGRLRPGPFARLPPTATVAQAIDQMRQVGVWVASWCAMVMGN
jgi:hypothetical protein